jgi:hypothetical protein
MTGLRLSKVLRVRGHRQREASRRGRLALRSAVTTETANNSGANHGDRTLASVRGLQGLCPLASDSDKDTRQGCSMFAEDIIPGPGLRQTDAAVRGPLRGEP